jgi:5-hydroxyisourate hydrolase
MTTCSTHVLDAALGVPAAGLVVTLTGAAVALTSTTDDDGRISWPGELQPGTYELEFGTGDWFAAAGRETFFPEVHLTVDLGGPHTHVALLLSPFSYTTYKGS